jgi:site-specific recombinase XerD
MPRLSHYFLPRLLLSEKRILYLDGANQINPLLIAHFARLAHSTVRKYKLLKRQMEEFAKGRGLRFLVEFDLPSVSQFRASWKDGPRSSAKKLERLRAFFRFAQKRKWIAENPPADLKAPRVTLCPTLPFTSAEMLRILAAIDKYKDEFPGRVATNARRIRTLAKCTSSQNKLVSFQTFSHSDASYPHP